MMKLAFVLFHYFPYGGLERDMLAMAQACRARGHDVTIYTQSWEGEKPSDIPVQELPVRALTNHGSALAFVKKFHLTISQSPPDLVVGFNKMPGLDVYYAADVCFAQKAYDERSWLYRLSARSRTFLEFESAVFGASAKTRILMISKAQIEIFKKYYSTPDKRLFLLPPGIRRDRVMPDDYPSRRELLRYKYNLATDHFLLLLVGSDFSRKGLDRAIRALAMVPEQKRKKIQLWAIGQDKPDAFLRLAKVLGVAEQTKILMARDDVSELMWAADLLLHPAYSENTGTVLLEAMVAGLPVIATDVCGYAQYIDANQMGLVLGGESVVEALREGIINILNQDASQWRARGQQFANQSEIFSMKERAVELIESFGADK